MEIDNGDLFPKRLEDEVLYIIGNGFDIAHNIESKYSDFEKWCRNNKHDTGIFDALFSTKEDFWGNLEEALGNYDEKTIMDFCKPDDEFDMDHSLSSSAKIEDAPMFVLKPALDGLKTYFNEWVDSISLLGIEPFLKLDRNAKYLTFNYTETLEKIYNIPRTNICHIHGNRLIKNHNCIFGHNNYREEIAHDEDLLLFEENAYLSIFQYFNEFVKPIQSNISRNFSFFNSLKNIKLVYVLGHSLSEIDMPYFDYLLSLFTVQPKFIFSSNSRIDTINISGFVKKKGINHHKIIDLEDLNKAM